MRRRSTSSATGRLSTKLCVASSARPAHSNSERSKIWPLTLQQRSTPCASLSFSNSVADAPTPPKGSAYWGRNLSSVSSFVCFAPRRARLPPREAAQSARTLGCCGTHFAVVSYRMFISLNLPYWGLNVLFTPLFKLCFSPSYCFQSNNVIFSTSIRSTEVSR